MSFNKDKLKAQMQAKSPTKAPPAIEVPLTNLTAKPAEAPQPNPASNLVVQTVKPNGTSEAPEVKPNALKAVRKHRRAFAKDATSPYRTQRHAFEITVELKQQLKEAVAKHRAATGKKTSESAIIRTAITRYLKGEL